ncbi:response regulator [Halobacteriales archaeon Cl-PHB]
MTAERPASPVVLVVDDEPDVAETYAISLGTDYETRVVTGGEAALETMDDAVDAVLLDRRMPDMHGDAVLAEIRDRGYDCPIIMVTAVDPDLNILEMDFDDYLCKPVDPETLRETLTQHLDRRGRDPRIDRFFSLVSKLDVLESERPPSELSDDPEYQRIRSEVTSLAETLDDDLDDFAALHDTYREIERTG